MNKERNYVYLKFQIYLQQITVGEVEIRVHKVTDIEKWKTPDLVKQEAVDFFKSEHPAYKGEVLDAYYVGDVHVPEQPPIRI